MGNNILEKDNFLRSMNPSRYRNLVYYDVTGEKGRKNRSYQRFTGYGGSEKGIVVELAEGALNRVAVGLNAQHTSEQLIQNFLTGLNQLMIETYTKECKFYEAEGIDGLLNCNFNNNITEYEDYLEKFKTKKIEDQLIKVFFGEGDGLAAFLAFLHNKDFMQKIYSSVGESFLRNLRKKNRSARNSTDLNTGSKEKTFSNSDLGVRELVRALRNPRERGKKKGKGRDKKAPTIETALKNLFDKAYKDTFNGKISKEIYKLFNDKVLEQLKRFEFRIRNEGGKTISLEQAKKTQTIKQITLTQEEFAQHILTPALKEMTKELEKQIKEGNKMIPEQEAKIAIKAMKEDYNAFTIAFDIPEIKQINIKGIKQKDIELIAREYLKVIKTGIERSTNSKFLSPLVPEALGYLNKNWDRIEKNFVQILSRSPEMIEQILGKTLLSTNSNYTNISGNIGESLFGALQQSSQKLKMTGSIKNKRGQSLNMDAVDKAHEIGYQVKNYTTSFSNMTLYDDKEKIRPFGQTQEDKKIDRYLGTTTLRDMQSLILNAGYFENVTSIGRIREEFFYPILLKSISAFLRYDDLFQNDDYTRYRNNFYILNFKVVPTSLIFALIYVEVFNALKEIESENLKRKEFINRYFDYKFKFREDYKQVESIDKKEKSKPWYNYKERTITNPKYMNFLNQSFINFKGIKIDFKKIF